MARPVAVKNAIPRRSEDTPRPDRGFPRRPSIPQATVFAETPDRSLHGYQVRFKGEASQLETECCRASQTGREPESSTGRSRFVRRSSVFLRFVAALLPEALLLPMLVIRANPAFAQGCCGAMASASVYSSGRILILSDEGCQ